ncbi:hypothetical protein F9231_17425 [Bacillus safensis]|nr:hypothetical protein F9229_15895 [Bacillus safensis]KAB3543339.1 hypothetical protein F9231_17425 [Bacillus safensis]QSJ02377.1 pentapeptide repeat-containing protein [Bacillus sp. 3a]
MRVNLSNFADSRFKRSPFTPLKSSNFFNSKLIKVNLIRCNINDIDFTSTKIKGIDISTCFLKILM